MLKKLMLLTALCAALALPARAGHSKGKGKGLEHAPGQHHQEDKKGRSFDHLATDLKLSEDQKAKIKPIWDDTEEKMDALEADKSLKPDEMKAKLKAIHDAAEAKVKKLLTPDQLKKLEAMKAEAHDKAKEHAKEHAQEHTEKKKK